MTHTPGPWKVSKHGHVLDGDGNLLVHWDTMADRNDIEGHANARLIAAAPDMLAALKLAEKRLAGLDKQTALAFVLAAIAKAEGRQT